MLVYASITIKLYQSRVAGGVCEKKAALWVAFFIVFFKHSGCLIAMTMA